MRNRARWGDYVNAIEAMFDKTSTDTAPWRAVAANSKWDARLRVLEIVTEALKKGVNVAPPPVDISVARIAAEVLGVPMNLESASSS